MKQEEQKVILNILEQTVQINGDNKHRDQMTVIQILIVPLLWTTHGLTLLWDSNLAYP